MSGMIGRAYLDPGDELSGHNDPPRSGVCLIRWRNRPAPPPPLPDGLRLHFKAKGRQGTCNILIRYDDGAVVVVPFLRRMRLP